MSNLLQTVVAIIAAATTAILTFTSLVTAPLDARLLIVALAGAVLLFGVVFYVRGLKRLPRAVRRLLAAIAATVLAGGLVLLLILTVNYHSIVVTRTGSGRTGILTVDAARFPAEVTILLGVSHPGDVIEEFKAGFADSGGSAWWGIEKDRPTAKTFALHRFAHPRVFRIDYRMSSSYASLTLDSSITPPNGVMIDWVDPERFDRLLRWFWLMGGLVWIGGVAASLWPF